MSNLSNGHRESRLKREFKRRCQSANLPCAICHGEIEYSADKTHPRAFQADHILPVSTHPHLGYVMSNLQPTCRLCNQSKSNRPPPMGEWVPANW